ncbi:MAG: hypothetical protein M1833_006733 [Piccolia ochrophora]|nr:MAG: hypothetical protein M1833_006733 [Piccolia ochrophora]
MMQMFLLSCLIACLLFNAERAFTLPTEPTTPAPGTNTIDDDSPSPVIVKRARPSPPAGVTTYWVDCTDIRYPDIEDLCNVDCYAHLCLELPTTLQRNAAVIRSNRVLSGQGISPFSGPESRVEGYNVSRLDGEHNSAEEIPYASTSQGGAGDPEDIEGAGPPEFHAVIAGVTRAAQTNQGNMMSAFYRHNRIPQLGWFHIRYNSNSEYCIALNQWEDGNLTPQQREDICRKPDPPESDPIRRTFIKITKKGAGAAIFERAMRGFGVYQHLSKRGTKAEIPSHSGDEIARVEEETQSQTEEIFD